MCGIAGVLNQDRRVRIDSAMTRRMATAIMHRGPDAEGIWEGDGIALAHRRLSIIDLSSGSQPMSNEDGTIWTVFNGEIYNYRALRDALEAKGHRFSTNSDTEVLVHLYEDFGDRLVEKLRGMFAFAIWDRINEKLLLARDRVGQKPLYVYRDETKIVFGSEIKAILACENVSREIDPKGIDEYFCYGVIPGDRTIFRKIKKLSAGHIVTVDRDSWNYAPRRYWQFKPNIVSDYSVTKWRELIHAKLDETVQSHLVADVPVGAFLSGGIDSSIIVASLARLSQSPLQTFSIGFAEQRYNELPYARHVADRYDCQHVEEIVSPTAVASLDDLIRFYDEPFADSSAIPTLQLSKLASRHVKVVLSGDGGDEAFGGYRRYAHDLKESRIRRRLPAFLRRTIIAGLASVWPKADWLPRVLRAKTALTNLSLDSDRAYANTLTLTRLPLRRQLFTDSLRRETELHHPESFVADAFRASHSNDVLASMITADVSMLLPDDFLTKVDRASMAYGLEVRPPLVDHELLELASQIPSELKIHNGETKWILKEAYRDAIPEEVLSRPKQGFEIPIDDWLRGPLREMFEDEVLDNNSRASQYLDQHMIRRLFKSHCNKSGRVGGILWAVLVFSKWIDTYG